MDLSTVFNTIDQKILLSCLREVSGVQGNALVGFQLESSLEGLTQAVVMEMCVSTTRPWLVEFHQDQVSFQTYSTLWHLRQQRDYIPYWWMMTWHQIYTPSPPWLYFSNTIYLSKKTSALRKLQLVQYNATCLLSNTGYHKYIRCIPLSLYTSFPHNIKSSSRSCSFSSRCSLAWAQDC